LWHHAGRDVSRNQVRWRQSDAGLLSSANRHRLSSYSGIRSIMHPSFRLPVRLWLTLCASFALAACGTSKPPVYQNEEFSNTNTYSHTYAYAPSETCEAARRALLSQGYVITQSKPESINGRKNFQPRGDVHAEIEFHIVCAADGRDGKSSIAFVNALQEHYALKKVNNSASVGVGALGSLSLPFSASEDSLVKVASQTILEPNFYDRFFVLLDRYLTAPDMPEVPEASQ
jgi:hypothetical protein